MSATAPDAFRKTDLLRRRLLSAGPPLHIALDWAGSTVNRSGLASLLTGDWFLARYACNYFAPSFVPQRVGVTGSDPRRNCLICWFDRRVSVVECEAHVCIDCPFYHHARQTLLEKLSAETRNAFIRAGDAQCKLLALLSSSCPADWLAIGCFAAHVRQLRRKLKRRFEEREARLATCGFIQKRAAWKLKGKHVCRHGVFFRGVPGRGCPCMDAEAHADDWRAAQFMPSLDGDLRAIIVVPFNLDRFQRLGILQAEVRRRGW